VLLLPTWDGDILKGKVNYFDSAYKDEVKKKKIGQSAAKGLELDEGSTTSKSCNKAYIRSEILVEMGDSLFDFK
jgi:hypothetical protein